MSLYSGRLAILKKEIAVIRKKLKKKKFKKEQQIMIDFINGVTPHAEFNVNDKKIFLYKGDAKKGFQHILERHYCIGCTGEVSTMEILNMMDIVRRGIKLENKGVTNNNLIVYYRMDTQHKLVLKPNSDNEFVVTMYSIC
jgi:hypothetical protein